MKERNITIYYMIIYLFFYLESLDQFFKKYYYHFEMLEYRFNFNYIIFNSTNIYSHFILVCLIWRRQYEKR